MTRLPDSFVCLRGSGAKAVREAAGILMIRVANAFTARLGQARFIGANRKTARGKESRVPNITFFPTFLLSLLPSPTEHARLCSSFRVNCFGSCGPDCTCHSFLSRSEPDLIGFSAPASPSPWTTLSWMMIFLTSRAMLEAPTLSQNLRRYACPIRAGKGLVLILRCNVETKGQGCP